MAATSALRPRVTSVDVARRAGVSQSTVSLVLSGQGRGADLRAHGGGGPRAPPSELGYRPNVAARALRTGVARSVALVVPDITNPFFGRVLRGAQAAAQARRLHRRAGRHRRNDRALGGRVAGGAARRPRRRLLCCSFEADLPPGAAEHAIQIETRPGGLPVVRLDVEGGTDAALDHLLELGHRRIGHARLALRTHPTFRPAPRAGGRRGVGRSSPPTCGPARGSTSTTPRAAARRAARRRRSATAVFCDDDILAGGVYLAARERGAADPRGPLGRRLRRPRLRARARAAADHGRAPTPSGSARPPSRRSPR